MQRNRDSSLGGRTEFTGKRNTVRVLRKGWGGAVERVVLLLIREADCCSREKSHEWGAWWAGMGLRWPVLLEAFLGILFFVVVVCFLKQQYCFLIISLCLKQKQKQKHVRIPHFL